MKRLTLLAGALAIAAALHAQNPPPGRPGGGPPPGRGMGVVGGVPSIAVEGPTVTGAPFSALRTTVAEQRLADGNRIERRHQARVYRDSQGRTRAEHAGPEPQAFISIEDPVAGFVYSLHPDTQTAEKMPLHVMGGGRRPPVPRPGGTPPKTEDLGTQMVNGVEATGTRTTQTIPAGDIGNAQPIQIVRERWVATALKVPVLIKTSDPRSGTVVIQLTEIVQAEPNASLFQVPANYAITDRPRGVVGGVPARPRRQ